MLPDSYVLTRADREAIDEIVWDYFTKKGPRPDAAAWELHRLTQNEHRVKSHGRPVTVGQIRELICKDEQERHLGFYRCAADSKETIYDAFACRAGGSGFLLFGPAVRENDPQRYATIMRRTKLALEEGIIEGPTEEDEEYWEKEAAEFDELVRRSGRATAEDIGTVTR